MCLSFVLTCSSYPDLLYACLPPASFATFLANLLFTSSNKSVLFAALAMVEERSWTQERYRETVEVLRALLPTLDEGREGFAPA